jgi:hypothetical protein
MTDDPRRFTRVDDPSLSPEANRLVDSELREATGVDIEALPSGAEAAPGPVAASHGGFVAALIDARLLLGVTFVVVLIAGLVATLATGAWLILVGLLALHAVGTIAVALGVVRLAGETEHVSPELAARLEAEGVGDPDRMFTDLVAEVRRSSRQP